MNLLALAFADTTGNAFKESGIEKPSHYHFVLSNVSDRDIGPDTISDTKN